MLAQKRPLNISTVAKPPPDFGDWLRERRGSQSQASFGKELGVSENTIRAWEGGTSEPQAGNLVMIGRKFGVDYNTLMSYFGAPTLRSVERMVTTIKRRPKLEMLFAAASELDEGPLSYLLTTAAALKREKDRLDESRSNGG